MVGWFIPALKAVLPHVGSILSAAMPVFTKKNTDAGADRALLQQQISELQSAVSQNAAHIKELAAQLQTAIAALEQTLVLAETRYRRAWVLAGMGVFISVVNVVLLVVFLTG